MVSALKRVCGFSMTCTGGGELWATCGSGVAAPLSRYASALSALVEDSRLSISPRSCVVASCSAFVNADSVVATAAAVATLQF